MTCPCPEVFITTIPERAEKELDRRYEQFPDCQDEIWDVYYDAEMGLCEECPYLELGNESASKERF